jgi:DNA invertase Pin-like site-specific DNA recombinase
MVKAYSYKRFSTPEQSKGDSLRRQSELSEKYAKEHGLVLDTTIKLTDMGISAFDKSNITKGTLGVFLKLIEEGKIEKGSYLLVESLDRISRAQILDALNIFSGIINAGITIVSLKENISYSKDSINENWTSLIVSLVSMSRAAEESLTKSFRGRASWDNKRANINEKRLTSRCPYWLKPTSDKTGFEVIPERADIVRKIFDMAKNGMGNHTITIRLNQDKVPTFSTKTDGWHNSYVQKLLRNKAVYGEFQLNTQRDGLIKPIDQPIANYYPAIIPKDEWNFVNNLRQSRITKGGVKKGKHLSNLFSGLLKCGYCGSTMTMGGYAKPLKSNTGKKSKYVACSKARRGLGCIYAAWNYNELESEILEYCNSLDFAQALGKSSTLTQDAENARKHAITLKLQIDEVEQSIHSLISALEKTDIKTSPESIVKRISDLETKSYSLKIELEKAESNANSLEIDSKSQEIQKDAIIETIHNLRTLEDTQLHDLRIRLSSQINQAIKRIALFPKGTFISPEKKLSLESSLWELDFEDTELNQYFSDIEKGANKQHRHLVILFHNGNVLQLNKNEAISNFKRFTKQNYKALEIDNSGAK